MRIEDVLRLAIWRPISTWSRWPRWPSRPSASSWTTASSGYESALKAREDRKKQVNTVIKGDEVPPEGRARPRETKKGQPVRFLKAGDKVKITIMFRGREQSRPELGFRLLKKLADDVNTTASWSTPLKQDG